LPLAALMPMSHADADFREAVEAMSERRPAVFTVR
jgi:hypothetical protein